MTSSLEPGPVERQGSATNVKLTKVAVLLLQTPGPAGLHNTLVFPVGNLANQFCT